MPLTPSQIVAALKKWRVNYRLYPGWETRGRPGTFGPINGFIWHHTGSDAQSDSYLKFLFIDGRAAEGIPGPLCQFAIRSNGEVWVGAAGRANHAGRGSSSTLAKVRDESYSGYSSEINPGPDDIDGNARYYGVEIMYSGSHTMTAAQYESALRLGRAITEAIGGTPLSAIGHREHSSRKWDPGSHKMYTMRKDTRDLSGEGEIDLTPEEHDLLVNAERMSRNVAAALYRLENTPGQKFSDQVWGHLMADAISGIDRPAHMLLRDTRVDASKVKAAVDAGLSVDATAVAAAISALLIPAVVDAVSAVDNLTIAEVEAAVESGVSSVLLNGVGS